MREPRWPFGFGIVMYVGLCLLGIVVYVVIQQTAPHTANGGGRGSDAGVTRPVQVVPAGCDFKLLVHDDKVVRHALDLAMGVVADGSPLRSVPGRVAARAYLAEHYGAMRQGECGVG